MLNLALSMEPNDNCILKSKIQLCRKFFDPSPEEQEACFMAVHPNYNKVCLKRFFRMSTRSLKKILLYFQANLNVCVTNSEEEKRCLELRHLCDEYIFVAVYAPGWPKTEEYELTCPEMYSTGIPLGIPFLQINTYYFTIAFHIRL